MAPCRVTNRAGAPCRVRCCDARTSSQLPRMLAAATRAPPPTSRTQFAPGRSATLTQLAADAVDTRRRTITHSYYPLQHVPWGSMVARDAFMSLCVTTAYAAVAYTLVFAWVRVRCAARREARRGARREARGWAAL